MALQLLVFSCAIAAVPGAFAAAADDSGCDAAEEGSEVGPFTVELLQTLFRPAQKKQLVTGWRVAPAAAHEQREPHEAREVGRLNGSALGAANPPSELAVLSKAGLPYAGVLRDVGGDVHDAGRWLPLALLLTGSAFAAAFVFNVFLILVRIGVTATAPRARSRVQSLTLTFVTLAMVNSMIILPESYDIMLETGYGMEASGWLIGTAWALQPITVVAQMPFAEALSDRAQKLTGVVAAAGFCLAALVYAWSAHPIWVSVSDNWRFAGLLVGRLLTGPFDALGLPLCLLAQAVTPSAEMVSYMIWFQLAATVGIGFGPIASSLANTSLRFTGIRARAAVPVLGISVAWLGMLVLIVVVWPTSTVELREAKAKADKEELAETGDGVAGNCLDDAGHDTNGKLDGSADSGTNPSKAHEKEELAEAGDGVADNSLDDASPNNNKRDASAGSGTNPSKAHEDAGQSAPSSPGSRTSEQSYRIESLPLSTAAGYMTGCAFLMSIPFTLLAKYALHVGLINELALVVISSGLAFASSFFIFPRVGVYLGCSGAMLLLASDCVTFANGFLAGGVMQGWGLRSSDPQTFMNQANFTAAGKILQNGVGRLLGPVLARWCIDKGGRTFYAASQCSVTAMGLATCLLVSVKLVIVRRCPS